MQIKKCQWINKPEKTKILSSRTLSFTSTSTHALFYTFEEEGKLTLSWDKDESVSLYVVYLNTDIEHIAFTIFQDRVEKHLALQGIETTDIYKVEGCKSMDIIKKDDTLTFLINDEVLSSFKRANLRASVSLGLAVKGEGKATFNFSFSQE